MKQNYADCLTRLLKDEGGWTNDPQDNGGATNYGITIADYRKYINAKGTPTDVKNMSLEDAKRIYKTKYWDTVGGDNLPSGIDYIVFDYGVNSGVSRSLRILKKFDSITDVDKKIDAICDERMAFLKQLSDWEHFKKGWTNRVEGGRIFAHKLAKSPSTKTVTAPVAIGGGVAAGTIVALNQSPDYWPYVIGALAIAAIATFVYFKFIRKAN